MDKATRMERHIRTVSPLEVGCRTGPGCLKAGRGLDDFADFDSDNRNDAERRSRKSESQKWKRMSQSKRLTDRRKAQRQK